MLHQALQFYRSAFAGLSRNVWLISIVLLINRSGTMVLPFLTVYLTQERGFTLVEAGWVMMCFGAGSMAGAYIGGWLTDRFGFYSLMFWSLVLTGLGFIWLSTISTLLGFCVWIFLITTVSDSFRPASMTAIAAYSKPENMTRSISLVRLAINLGFSIGPAAAGFLSVAIGYRWLFVIDGAFSLFAAVFYILMLPKKDAQQAKADAKAQAVAGARAAAWRDRPYLVFLLCSVLTAIVFMQIFSTWPVYLKEAFGLADSQIGLYITLNGVLIVLTEMPLIYVLERRYRPLRLIAFGVLLIGLSYFVFNLFPLWTGAIVLSILAITFGEVINFPFANTFALGRSRPENRGAYMGLFTMTFSLANIVSPVLGTNVAQHLGYPTLWNVLMLMSAVAFVGYWWLGAYLGPLPLPSAHGDTALLDDTVLLGEKESLPG